MTNAEIDRVRDLWGIQGVPERHGEFLSLMGCGAGGILRGTGAFFPVILGMRRAVDDFFSDNHGGVDLPDGAVVFAMHQGCQVYWMELTSLQDPPASLCMEGEAAPMVRWESFAEFLNSEYVNTCPEF
ncbi:SMI1/KNR4 family protein [Kitasatospora sp. NPDC059811]|uniref:SMI1/KNR4 family protein n=1 Tax=Streptomycetaceae TaxID=2062 RepID=UPI001331786B|nr:SMI1/KNR4 family protein [Streptomyces sp. MJM8645]